MSSRCFPTCKRVYHHEPHSLPGTRVTNSLRLRRARHLCVPFAAYLEEIISRPRHGNNFNDTTSGYPKEIEPRDHGNVVANSHFSAHVVVKPGEKQSCKSAVTNEKAHGRIIFCNLRNCFFQGDDRGDCRAVLRDNNEGHFTHTIDSIFCQAFIRVHHLSSTSCGHPSSAPADLTSS